MDKLRNNATLFTRNPIQWQNEHLLKPHVGRRVMFLAAQCITGLPMFWSFGWHGNETLAEMDVLYAVPRVLLWIPFLKDLLIASGAVADEEQTLLSLMKKEGRAVCYAPGRMRDILRTRQADRVYVSPLNEHFIESLVERDVVIVPVVFHNELGRYPIWPSPSANGDDPKWKQQLVTVMDWVRSHGLRFLGFPCPIIFGWNRKEKITTMIGAPVDTKGFQGDANAVRKAVHNGWVSMGNSFDMTLIIEE